jgi:hypothetical protein
MIHRARLISDSPSSTRASQLQNCYVSDTVFCDGDPLSVLGAAIGVTSLIIKLTDECVKGLKHPNVYVPS